MNNLEYSPVPCVQSDIDSDITQLLNMHALTDARLFLLSEHCFCIQHIEKNNKENNII